MADSYRFGDVEVRPAERRVLVNGRPAALGSRAFDVLLALIDRRDRVVTKDELLDVAWPGLVVEENNLQVQVSTLRKILGTHAVATVPGRGYRFTLQPEAAPGAPPIPSAPGHNLPAALNGFIGREREMAEVDALLEQSRMVTITSAGGTGKTRLALEVARAGVGRFADGVWFVELAPVARESGVAQSVAAVLGVREAAGAAALEALERWMRARSMLLVLDNCEHLLPACAELAARLLRAAPGLTLLATSREALRVAGETAYPLSSFPTPDPDTPIAAEAIAQYDAVRLFVDRAKAANAAFRLTDENGRAVTAICRRLDGIPLAIELAAARVRALSPENIAVRLAEGFRLLTSGDRAALPRHQTLRASMDWSHELLTSEERVLFRRLAVFAGGWTLEAAEAVAAGDDVEAAAVLDVLTRLVEKCLVEAGGAGERYRLLEPIRQYALEKLDGSGEGGDVRARHAQFFVRFAEEARAHLGGADQARGLLRLDRERENLVAAHDACARIPRGDELGLRLASSLRMYCVSRGLLDLGRRLNAEALERAPKRSLMRSRVLFDAGQLAYYSGRYAEARTFLEESIDIASELKDKRRVATALQLLGMACFGEGDMDGARARLESALAMAREVDDERELSAALNALAQLRRATGDVRTAAKLFEEALALARRRADSETIAVAQLNLAMACAERSVAERAALLAGALEIARSIGSRYVGQSGLEVCAGLAALAGQWTRAARCYGAAEAQAERTGMRRDPADEAFLAPLVQRAREAMPGGDFARAERDGRALDYDAALAEAAAWIEEAAAGR